ncbi:MAG: pilus assembly protein, partial [Gammaproteobacteria bacterium]
AITDGYPTYDTHFPGNDPDDQADTNHALPDWDGKHPETHRSQYPNFPQYSDGFQPEGDARYEGYTLYLDDLAKFAWDIDLRKGGTDNAGESFDDPDFKQQNMFTYTVGFAVANQMLQDAAEYGHGLYYTAENANELKHVLLQALQDIAGKSAASASTVANTVYATVGGKVYLGRFNSGDWSGQFLAFELDNDPESPTFGRLKKNGPGPDGSLWDGGKKIPPADNRVILSYDPETRQGIPFRWDNLNDAQKGLLGNEDILNYLRGDRSKEQQNGGSFRDRSTLLGDIIHASPAYVGKPDAGYTDESYKAFVQAKRHRTSVIYTSANDGMLHGFHGDTGDELLAYVPNALFRDNIDDDDAPQLKQLTDPNYQHRYYVDGPPTAMDAYLKDQWRTVLI